MSGATNPFAAVPEVIQRGQGRSRLAGELGDLSVQVIDADASSERMRIAAKLRELADRLEQES